MIEPGETPANAAVRETWEETGLIVALTRIVGVFGGERCTSIVLERRPHRVGCDGVRGARDRRHASPGPGGNAGSALRRPSMKCAAAAAAACRPVRRCRVEAKRGGGVPAGDVAASAIMTSERARPMNRLEFAVLARRRRRPARPLRVRAVRRVVEGPARRGDRDGPRGRALHPRRDREALSRRRDHRRGARRRRPGRACGSSIRSTAPRTTRAASRTTACRSPISRTACRPSACCTTRATTGCTRPRAAQGATRNGERLARQPLRRHVGRDRRMRLVDAALDRGLPRAGAARDGRRLRDPPRRLRRARACRRRRRPRRGLLRAAHQRVGLRGRHPARAGGGRADQRFLRRRRPHAPATR